MTNELSFPDAAMTTQPPTNQPLWRVMEEAFLTGRQPGHCDRLGYAAEIEAIRDRIVPEESIEIPVSHLVRDLVDRALLRERQRIRALLTAEAERARAGE